jgi:RNA polymerase sigma factor (sigma-70 family)
MYGVCLRYAQNYDEAQDILQEGFIKVFANLKSYRNEGDLEGWIRRIVINTAIEKYRARIKDLAIYNDEMSVAYSDSNLGLEFLNVSDLLELVQSLPMQYRLIFNLYVIEGFSHKEIGEQLNINESTSRSNLARARAILQKALAEEEKVVQKVV